MTDNVAVRPVGGTVAAYRLVLVALLAVALLILRKPDAFLHPDFWAEDGVVFWRGWVDYGFGSFVRPYAGYLHLTPRTIAAVTAVFPTRFAVDVFLAGSVIFTAWTSITIALVIPGRVGIFAALAPLLAFGAWETLGTPTNIQWTMACGMAIIAVSRLGAARATQINSAGFLGFAALTGPFSIFAAPVFFIRAILAWRAKARFDVGVSAGVLVGAAIQIFYVANSAPAERGDKDPQPLLMAGNLVFHAVGGWTGMVGLAILFFSLFVGRFRWQRTGLALIAAAIIAAVLIKFSHQPGVFSSGRGGFRYWYIPSAFAFFAFAYLLREVDRPLRIAGVIGIVSLLSGYLFQPFVIPAWKHYGTWADALDAGSTTYKFPPGWTIKIPKED